MPGEFNFSFLSKEKGLPSIDERPFKTYDNYKLTILQTEAHDTLAMAIFRYLQSIPVYLYDL